MVEPFFMQCQHSTEETEDNDSSCCGWCGTLDKNADCGSVLRGFKTDLRRSDMKTLWPHLALVLLTDTRKKLHRSTLARLHHGDTRAHLHNKVSIPARRVGPYLPAEC
ncbi:hypothetical protein F2P81_018816 [Scophthalmus maximus]|uniref:Uncharacterized protein n=1 Tax=Scophthalmus maximus TaxID=52904 RepID=A0A6A4SEY2_SCOMX|nr:hypothetical protein F2P81_018816 [Scophthalmus maximus]